MDFKKLLIRSISGLVYVGIIVGCILWGNNGIALLGVLLAILATIEFENICHDVNRNTMPLVILDVMGVVLLSISFNPLIPFVPLALWIIVMLARVIFELYTKNENPLSSLSHSFFAQFYIGLPLSLMSASSLIGIPHSILIIFILLWINDTGAYLVGSMIGKHRLFERISPKKSWEGFFGGVVFAIIAAIIFSQCGQSFLGISGSIWKWIGLAIVVTVFGTWGDLIESLIKRHLHIKDSGNIIPGHGGILDRIDSFLIAMPAAFLYLFLPYFVIY